MLHAPSSLRLILVVVCLFATVRVAHAQQGPIGPVIHDAQLTTLSFDDAVDHALATNLSVAAAAQEIARGEAVLTSVRAGWLPSLYANAAYTRLDSDRKLDNRITAAQDQLSANLLLTVPLLAPQRWVNSAHAASDLESAKRSLQDVRRSLAISVARTYLAIVTQHRVVEIATRALQTANVHAQFTAQRWQAHYGSRLDDVRAKQEAASAEAQLESAQAQLETLQESLGGLLGVPQALDAADDKPLNISNVDLAGQDEELLQGRTDLRLASQLLQASEQVVHDDWALHAPTLLGTFSPFYQNPATTLLPSTGWQAQLVLQLPLFEGNLRVGQAHEHQSIVARRRFELDARLMTARAELRGARKEALRLQKALTHAQTAAALAQEAFDLADLAYKAGATTNLEVVDAERRARDAATSAVVADDGLRRAQLGVLIALGRFPH